MSLLEQAIHDARQIVEGARGFASQVKVTSPTGSSLELRGLAADVTETYDEEGAVISGRQVSVTLSLNSLSPLGVPQGEPSARGRPWVVETRDHAGILRSFKVVESKPDLTLGVIVLRLEPYQAL